MRVIMITPGYYPIRGGTEAVVRNLTIELNTIGVRTDIMTFNMDRKWSPRWRGEREETNGITIFRIPGLNWLPIDHSQRITLGINLIPGRFTNILKNYDIVHFHEADFSFPLFSFFVKKAKILHLHGIDVEFYRRYRLSRYMLKHVADFYISISRQMKTDLIGLGIPEEKILYLPNGVDTKLFQPLKKKEDNLILFVGRITFEKGLHVLLESLRYMRTAMHLVIVGPADWSPRYYQEIMRLIEEARREGKHTVEYLGTLEQREVAKWCQRATIFALPSFTEAFPVAVLEALSCGTPVVATAVGGIPEIVQDYKNGILVPPDNPRRLAEAIQYLIDSEEIREAMGKQGRKSILEHFSLESVSNKLSDFYDKIVNG